METGGALKRGDDLLLRYVYNDGTLQAALPLRVVVDTTDVTVGWLTPRTPIMYWATSDAVDPRKVPLDRRFRQRLTTAPRVWEGPGVLRVMLIAGLQDWPSAIGDWRSFRPDPAWTTPDLNHWPPASE